MRSLKIKEEYLFNSFSYSDLEAFYNDAAEQIRMMESMGCDVKIFYFHWREEYMDEPDEDQVAIAQQLCDMGVGIIIGGHPHVIQKYDTLENANGHHTICLYSMGNELSNQRKELMNEDYYRGYIQRHNAITVGG